MKAIAIYGSSRSNGNTRKTIDAVLDGQNVEVINVKEQNISPYDYKYFSFRKIRGSARSRLRNR